MKRTIGIISATFALALSAGCGNNNHSSAHAVINGQEYEMGTQSVGCWAGPSTGAIYGGVADSPVSCTINFRSRTLISDYLKITVNSSVSIFRDYLGTWIPMTAGLVWAELTFNGLPETMYQGQIRFDNMSNYQGDEVCAAYEIQTGNGLIEGSFCGEVSEGY